jgi:inorganic triphosphatase YgiF
MAVETELKFRVPARKLASIGRWRIPGARPGKSSDADLDSTYFDTARSKLKRHGLTLRVREMGEKRVQTIKSQNGAQFGRDEWETEINDAEPDLDKTDDTPLASLASKKLRRKLKPVFETSVHRITVPLRTGRSEIELAIDRGRIVAGRRSLPIEELELELKSGRPVDLFRLARTIERKAAAELDLRSKSERGYALARGKATNVASAEAIALEAEMPAGDAFRIIARSAVRHFSGNADAVREADPEGVHQMRVGLRPLRAAISLFSKVLSPANTEAIKAELKWLTGELAPAREIDVFMNENIKPATRDVSPRRGGRVIEKEFGQSRDRAFAQARKAVNSEHYRALLLDTLAWIESGHTTATERARTPIGEFAVEVLDRRIKKARKQGRRLDGMSARERHKVRIRIKKIRYGVDFFETLFSRRKQKKLARLSRHLKRIQDALGALNDSAAHRKMAEEAALKAPRQHRRARAFVSGVVLGREDAAVMQEARALEAV